MAYDKTQLTPDELKKFLAEHSHWKNTPDGIRRTFEFKDFLGSMAFVNQVAQEAEAANHHPDIDIRWNKVTLTLTTHDAGGLTWRDTKGAAGADAIATKIK